MKQLLMNNCIAMSSLSRGSLVLRIGLVGAVAGFLAWAVVLLGHIGFGIGRPSGLALLLAIPRGALFGIIIALILYEYWKKHPIRSEMEDD